MTLLQIKRPYSTARRHPFSWMVIAIHLSIVVVLEALPTFHLQQNQFFVKTVFFSTTKQSSNQRFFATMLQNGDRQENSQDVTTKSQEWSKEVGECMESQQRRKLFEMGAMTMASFSLSFVSSISTAAAQTISLQNNEVSVGSITVPLEKVGDAYLIYYRVDGSLFRAILDTGSPFLLIPGSCSDNTKSKTGCYRKQGIPSGLASTYEQFAGFSGEVEWRMAPFSFVNGTMMDDDGALLVKNSLLQLKTQSPPQQQQQQQLLHKNLFTFGVASDDIMSGPGGVFFGLIRDTDEWIRPSFLKQTSIQSFEINLLEREAPPSLTLFASRRLPIQTTESPFPEDAMMAKQRQPKDFVPRYLDYIRLNNDLLSKYGDPVNHYTAVATSIVVNGIPLVMNNNNMNASGKKMSRQKPIYAIFDTGVTGMVMSEDLFVERYRLARERKERNLWGNVTISFPTSEGDVVELSASKPITTPFDPRIAWKGFRGHLVVLGLAFLDKKKITIDIDRERLWIQE